MMLKCPKCGADVEEEKAFCPDCGALMTPPAATRRVEPKLDMGATIIAPPPLRQGSLQRPPAPPLRPPAAKSHAASTAVEASGTAQNSVTASPPMSNSHHPTATDAALIAKSRIALYVGLGIGIILLLLLGFFALLTISGQTGGR